MMNPSLAIFFATAVYSMNNGSPASQREFGYIVSIIERSSHLCSGIIIDKTHVLTTAHIVLEVSFTNLGIISGLSSFTPYRSYSRSVKEVYVHPGFQIRYVGPDETYYDNDIVLLRLHQQFHWDFLVAPAPLENTEYDRDDCFRCILISWEVPMHRRTKVFLTWELVAFMNSGVDQRSAQYLGEHGKFFSDVFGRAGINDVDLGSPIVCGNFTRGFVLHGEQNEIPGKPSVMMPIAPYLGYIQEIIRDGLFDVERDKYPYVASIWSETTYVCGGFIVDATHIATAGHCVTNDKAMNYTVAVEYPPESTQWLAISNITIHSDYKVNYLIQSAYQLPTWSIDHDFAILTLTGIISWSEGAGPLTLSESDDLHEGKICEVLRWKCHRNEILEVDAIELMSSRVALMDGYFDKQLDSSTQFRGPSFWGRTLYAMPIADSSDVGNPIICEGNPVGFLIQAIPFYRDPSARVAKFLKIRPYLESS